MICNNCGAKYDENLIECPFCGAENLQAAEREHLGKIKEVKEKTKDLAHVPDRVVKKSTSVLLRAGLIFLAVAVVACAAAFIISKNTSSGELERQNEQLEVLEGYYKNGEYAQMDEYLDEIEEAYRPVFEKYRRVSRLYDAMSLGIDMLSFCYDNAPGYVADVELIAGDLEYVFGILNEVNEFEQAGFLYGESEGALYVRTQLENALKEYMQLNADEMSAGEELAAASADESEYLELAKACCERLAAISK